MCGRFSLGVDASILAAQFDLFETSPWTPRYNIAPTQEVLVVVQDPATARRQARRYRWGLIPSWAKDPAIGNQLINAQAETAATKPAFRVAFRRRRCLILADGFYEWKTENRHKQPYYIRLHNGWPFAFAGLWEHWEGPGGKAIDSCTILTTTPNDLLRPLHHLICTNHVKPQRERELPGGCRKFRA
ncbi:MAG: SOS response-associated peptidase [Candidatus Methylomirabilales bacterium]